MLRHLLRLLALLGLGWALTSAPPAEGREKPQFAWDRYLDQAEVTRRLETLHEAYPDLTRLETIGHSAEGRPLLALTIGNPATGDLDAKPAMYVDGAIHGNEIQATEVCLYLAWLLLDRYDEWERITELVDRVVFHVVPTVNVDGRTRFFADPGSHRIGRSARVPYDDDYDGRLDEDPPEDLDGDGLILIMRVADPHGTHRTDPDDPRVVVRTQPGEQGEWTLLGLEGIDDDGDGLVNEDGPGYLDMNRNWGAGWQPRYVQAGAGDFPFSAPETRAVSDFVAAHPHIGFVFAFHNYGGMFLRGPGSDLAGPYAPQDIDVWDWLGREGERTVPGYRYLISGQDLYRTHGDFDEFMYLAWGVLGFTGELYMSSEVAYRGRSDEPNGDDGNLWSRRPDLAERQEFNDQLMAGTMFREWRPYDHPQYGPIEIGGWKPLAVRSSPGWMLPEMVHRNAMFVVWTATQLPRVTVSILATEDLGDGLWRVRARAVNETGLPTLTAQARLRAIVRPDQFALAGDDIEVVGGGLLADRYLGTVAPVAHRPWRLETHLDGFATREAEWIVRGTGEVAVSYDGVRCGRHEATGRLQ